MRLKSLVLGGVGLATLLVTAVFVVWAVQCIQWLTGAGPGTEGVPPSSAPGAAASRTAETSPVRPSGPVPGRSAESGEPFPVLQRNTHRTSRGARAALTRDVGAAMKELKPRLLGCPDQQLSARAEPTAAQRKLIESVQRQIASRGDGESIQDPVPVGEGQEGGGEYPTILMLEVETFDSQVKIVDAALAMRGSASDAFLACAQQVLRGQILFAPAAASGDHLRIPVDLSSPTLEAPPQRHATRRHR